ncbi:MAG: hypothetical protein MUF07_18415 [Steroidobacteraceae bacterium]|jgi:hypothetical protein|nr:hypothetical protein [Steroidobacteraceae bacterium]
MAAPGTDDPYERIAPLFQGTIHSGRRDALRALLGATAGAVAALGTASGLLAPAVVAAAGAAEAPRDPADWVRRSGTAAGPGVLPFLRLYAGPDRITRAERRDIVLTTEPTPGLLIQPAETFAIRVIPPGTSFDWHKPSRPRITALLRGRATFTLRDGTQGVVLPGTIALVENVDSDGHRGEFHPDEYTITVDVGLPLPRPAG